MSRHHVSNPVLKIGLQSYSATASPKPFLYVYGVSVQGKRMERGRQDITSAADQELASSSESKVSRLKRVGTAAQQVFAKDWDVFVEETQSHLTDPKSILGCVVKFGEVSPAFVCGYLDRSPAEVRTTLTELNHAGIIDFKGEDSDIVTVVISDRPDPAG